jgi:hypothetical protein
VIDDLVLGALYAAGAYLAVGALFAVPFLLFGIGRVDPAAKGAPLTFRALVLPGVVAMWPLLFRRWVGSRRVR